MHSVSEVPSQRRPQTGLPATSRDVLRSLGLDVLVDIIEKSSYGVCVTGDDHSWVYLNPAGAELIGKPFSELVGTDYLLSFPPHEREALLALEGEQREGDTAFYTNTVVREDGTEREMTWSGTVVDTHLGQVAPAIFHDTSGIRRAKREADALATAAARLASGGETRAVLHALAEAAVATTRALTCVVLVATDAVSGDGSGPLTVMGHSDGVDGSTRASALDAELDLVDVRLSDLPGGALLTGRRPVLLADYRRRLLASPSTAPLASLLSDEHWRASALLPLQIDGRVVGCLVALMPAVVRSPSEEETEFWASLADQAIAALTKERLRVQAEAAATASERLRIGRDLHDSVSHALFALRQRAELIERALDSGNETLLRAAAAGLKDVSQEAITDMRALLAELRPTSGATGDLADALRGLAEQVQGRHGLAVELCVDASAADRAAALGDDVRDHLLRVAGEAVHNTVKHAAAEHVTVSLALGEGRLLLSVRDDGRGLGAAGGSGHGLRTMRERMELCGGTLLVRDVTGGGTEVVAGVPVDAA
ncbi:MAG: histidine kinase [Actinomycetes bacterium]